MARPIAGPEDLPGAVIRFRIQQSNIVFVLLNTGWLPDPWREFLATKVPTKNDRPYFVIIIKKGHVQIDNDGNFQILVPMETFVSLATVRAFTNTHGLFRPGDETNCNRSFQHHAGLGVRTGSNAALINLGVKDPDVANDNKDNSVPDDDP